MLKLRACRFFHNCAWAYPVTPSGPPRREQGRPPAHETIRRAARPYAGRAGFAPSSSTKSHDPPARVPRWAAGGVRPLVSDRGARPGPPGVRGGRRAHHHRPVRARSTRHRRPAQRRHPHDAPRPPPAAPTATRPKASHTTRDASARQRHTHTHSESSTRRWLAFPRLVVSRRLVRGQSFTSTADPAGVAHEPFAMAGYLASYYDVDRQKVGERIVISDEQITYLFHIVQEYVR
jgi:hypothetical protein